MHLFCVSWKDLAERRPDDFVIDGVVVVGHDVAGAAHTAPGNLGMLVDETIR